MSKRRIHARPPVMVKTATVYTTADGVFRRIEVVDPAGNRCYIRATPTNRRFRVWFIHEDQRGDTHDNWDRFIENNLHLVVKKYWEKDGKVGGMVGRPNGPVITPELMAERLRTGYYCQGKN